MRLRKATVIEEAERSLLAIRSQRPRPHLDDKILTAWNGMMISAFAKGARILKEPRYETRRPRRCRFPAEHVVARAIAQSDATLLRRYRDGDAAIEGFLDDYAFLALALIDMYETTFDPADLDWAARLAERAMELFEDREQGGFFSTQAAKADLVLRLKDDYDGAEPSGNSAMALALLKLARIASREDFRMSAERALQAFAPRLASRSHGRSADAGGADVRNRTPHGNRAGRAAGSRNGERMLAAIHGRFLPGAVVMRAEQAPAAMPALDGKPTAYVCENYACKLPVTDDRRLLELLQ